MTAFDLAGRAVDPETGELLDRPPLPRDVRSRIDALGTALSGIAEQWRAPAAAREWRRRGETRLAELVAERDALANRLDHGWAWSVAHPDDPRTDRYADQWIGWLASYEAMSDAIADAEARLA